MKHDPEFKEFLNEILDNREAAKTNSTKRKNNKGLESELVNAEITELDNQQHLHQNQNRKIVKSPSDTTIYSPGLRKAGQRDGGDYAIEKISNFVENIRLDNNRKSANVTNMQNSSRLAFDHDHENFLVGDVRHVERRSGSNEEAQAHAEICQSRPPTVEKADLG